MTAIVESALTTLADRSPSALGLLIVFVLLAVLFVVHLITTRSYTASLRWTNGALELKPHSPPHAEKSGEAE